MQAWDFRPGQDFLHQMHKTTQQAARTIAVLSPAYLGSAFGEAEWRAAFATDPPASRAGWNCRAAGRGWPLLMEEDQDLG